MAVMDDERDIPQGELEFFGVKLRVKSSRLAELLNSGVDEDEPTIALRAPETFVSADDAGAERVVERRALLAESSVRIRPPGIEDG
jgi:hypothetical protein